MTSSVKQTVIKNPTWWKRRTGMERGLTLLSVVTIVISISLVIALGTVLYKNRSSTHESVSNAEALLGGGKPSPANTVEKTKNKYDDICLTPGCIHTASKVLDAMDQSIDPCDDFYQFACGSFVKKTNIPDDKSSVTSFSVISDTLLEQLRSMIEEPIQPKEAKPFRLTKLIYQSCMNKTKIEKEGLKPIKQIFSDIGGWPVLDGDNWNEEDYDWKQAVYNFRKVGYSVDYFIDFSVGVDLKNSTKRIIDLDQSSLGLRREFLIKGMEDKLVQAYYEYMVDIAVIYGADRARAEKELMESLEFEMKLANISLPNEKRRNASSLYNPMTVGQLIIKYPSIPWLTYINTLLSLDFQIGTDEIVIVSVPQFISDFEDLIAKTPKRTQSNYLMWRAAASSASYLTEELKNRQLKYSTILTGKTERAPRWKECIDVSAGSLSIAAGALYVRKYFNEDAKRSANEMVADIRSEFKEVVRHVGWMDNVTRKGALEKIDLMATHIAYPDELLNTTKLEEFYESLEMDPNDYFKSILNMTLFGTRYSFNRLRKPVNKSEWITHGRPAVVNAFYSSIENSIQFPAGILQGVFFNNDRPKYMNYGAIGFVIGHEITHGFDDQGRQFDKNGNLVDWWQQETKDKFVKKAQCIIDQYGNFTVPEIGLNLNGINTQGENIADNGGIKEAYLAYNKWVEKHGPEQKLPGLKYNSHQLFWISAANVWCANSRNEELRQIVVTDEHSPDKFRVLGSFRNLDYFSKDFNCPEGSRMNPKIKCSVW